MAHQTATDDDTAERWFREGEDAESVPEARWFREGEDAESVPEAWDDYANVTVGGRWLERHAAALDAAAAAAEAEREKAAAAAAVRSKIAAVRSKGVPPVVHRGDVLFTLGAEIQSAAAELQRLMTFEAEVRPALERLKAFEARVVQAAKSPSGWLLLREELGGGK